MEIGGNGHANELARLLLGVQEQNRSSQSESQQRVERRANDGTTRVRESDRVSISDRGREFQQAQEAAQASDPARTDRITRIRERVEAGTFDVSGRKTGDSIVRNALIESVV